MTQRPNLTLMNAKLMFRNFAGEERQYNTKGDRNFCIFLDPDRGAQLRAEGWNIKQLPAREEGDPPQDYLQVKVSYKNVAPRCVMITSQGKTELDENSIAMFDAADYKKADVIINPYHWDVNGKQGIKAYLKSIFLTVNEDELELLYAGVQNADAGLNTSEPYDDEDEAYS